jgi:hypothetical protein
MSNRGMFRVDWQLWEDLGRPHGFNVHSMLLLPAACQVVNVTEQKVGPTECVMNVSVESELFPDQLGIADLMVIYGRKDGKPIFDHMRMKSEQGWERLPQP